MRCRGRGRRKRRSGSTGCIRARCHAGRWVVFYGCPAQAIDRPPGIFRILFSAKQPPDQVRGRLSARFVGGRPGKPRPGHDFSRRDRPTPAASSPIHNVQHRVPDIGTHSGDCKGAAQKNSHLLCRPPNNATIRHAKRHSDATLISVLTTARSVSS